MTRETFEQKLGELTARIDELPPTQREALKMLVEETRDRHDRITRHAQQAREGLSDWRIAMKYLAFDLEARQREQRG
ncbi:MAG: hypothetical protein ACE5EQ_02785 [Phycisphaerae bacterium]